jgi:hypothetical protein
VIVIHYTAGAEGRTSAEDGAAYDRRRLDGTSCHFFTDGDSIVQEVDTGDRAHAAMRNGNRIGIQVEQCGTVQTREQWLDANSRPMLTNTARVCEWAMRVHGIPLRRLTPAQVRAGARGICGHADITLAFPEDGGSHMDPGESYPWDVLFTDIQAIQAGGVPGEAPDMEPSDVLKRPTNVNYPGGNPTSFPTTGATSQPTLEYMAHATKAELDDVRAILLETRSVAREALAAAQAGEHIDYDALSTAVADKLAARLPLPTYTLAQIATAVADEQAQRQAE